MLTTCTPESDPFKFVAKNKSSAAQGPVSQNKSAPNSGRVKIKIKAKEKNVNESSLAIALRDNTQEFVENMLTLERPFLLPREIPTPVAPHLFSYSVKVSPPVGVTQGAMIIRPSPDAFMDLAEVETVPATLLDINQEMDSYTPNADLLTIDQTLLLPSGHVKCSTATGGLYGFHYSNSTKSLKPGIKYYPGLYTFSNSDIFLYIYNPNQMNFTADFQIGLVDANGNAVLYANSAPTVCPAKTNTQITIASATAGYATLRANSANAAQSRGFWIGCEITANLPGRFAAGEGLRVTGPTIAMANQIIWNRKSLWDALGSRAVNAKSQFDLASRHSVTGLNCVFSNVSNQFANGGSIYACRLPGDTFEQLPGDLPSLIELISSQTHHKLETYTLENGASYAHTPEKLQDYLFNEKVEVDPYNGNPLNLPYLVLVWDASVANAAQPVFNIHGRIMLEYLTTDVSNIFFMAPSDPGLMSVVVNELSRYNTLSENPEHIKHLINVAKKIATSDTAKAFYKVAINTGVKVAPLLLSMLV